MARTFSKQDQPSREKRSPRRTSRTGLGDLMPEDLVQTPVDDVQGSKSKVKKPKNKVQGNKKATPRKKEKTPEDLRKECLLNRVEILRVRALEMKIDFPESLEERLKEQETKGAIQRTWKKYLQSVLEPQTTS